MFDRDQIWRPQDYELLDFGGGRKLERFGGCVLDRPSPAAIGAARQLRAWNAEVQLDDSGKLTTGITPLPSWTCRFDLAGAMLQFQLRVTPFGHVGLFPEQATNWHWLARVTKLFAGNSGESISALNLFAYTGGTTMALAAQGIRVVHCDASAPAVRWARANATASGLQASAIHWIVEDARKFVARELRRGNRYHIVVLDPPSFGHGPQGKRWDIEVDMRRLLQEATQLLVDDTAAMLVTGHSETIDEGVCSLWLRESLSDLWPNARLDENSSSRVSVEHSDCSDHVELTSGRLQLGEASRRKLDAGFFVRMLKTREGCAS